MPPKWTLPSSRTRWPAGYYDRLDLWYQRVWKLQGLWLDPNGRVLRHKGKEAVLTHREFELLQFLLDATSGKGVEPL
jgi:hypothetical protein